MNEFSKKLKQEALTIKLSQNEKQHMRMVLYEAMKGARFAPAPVSKIKYTRVRSTYVWFSPRFALPVAAVLILGMGSGTAFAAQGSLPGDALYTIKVNVTEPALGALAMSDSAKAQWNAKVAQTRLEEAESLAASGKLDAGTSAQISQSFDEHSIQAQALAQKIDLDDPDTGDDLAAEFDSSLAAHDAILSRIGEESTSSKQFADEVVSHVRQHGTHVALASALSIEDNSGSGQSDASGEAQSFSTMSVRTFAAIAPGASTSSASSSEATSTPLPATTTTPKVKISSKLKKSAASALSDARDAFGSAKRYLDASTTVAVQARLDRISAAVTEATSSTALTAALKDATVLETFLQASKKFHLDFFIKGNNVSRFQDDNSAQNSGSKGDGKGDGTQNNHNASTTIEASTTLQVESGDDHGGNTSSGDTGGKGEDQKGDDNGGGTSGSSGGFFHNLINHL